jgi:hypothetical protein
MPGLVGSLHSALGVPSPGSAAAAVVALALLALLAEREILRAYLGTRRTVRLEILNVAIGPLLVAFVVIVLLRMTGNT